MKHLLLSLGGYFPQWLLCQGLPPVQHQLANPNCGRDGKSSLGLSTHLLLALYSPHVSVSLIHPSFHILFLCCGQIIFVLHSWGPLSHFWEGAILKSNLSRTSSSPVLWRPWFHLETSVVVSFQRCMARSLLNSISWDMSMVHFSTKPPNSLVYLHFASLFPCWCCTSHD